MGTPLALGEQATTVFADPRQVLPSARRGEGRGARARPEGARRSTRCSRDRSLGFVYVARKADPDKRGEAREAEALGLRLLRRGAAHVSAAARSRRRCSATQASTTRASPGSSSSSTSRCAATPGKQIVVRDPFGRPIKIDHIGAGAPRQGGVSHARPEDPGERRAGPAAEPSRSGARRARRRSCSTRRRAPCSRWRKRRRTTRTSSRPSRRGSSATTRSATSSSRGRCSRS